MIALLAAAVVAASPDSGAQLADLHRMYAQSCEVRAYASFDDLCNILKKQMREAERAHRRSARAEAAEPTTPVVAEKTESAPAPTRAE